MKTPEQIIQDVLEGMIGIGGIPSNEEFYSEFDMRLRNALGIKNEPLVELIKYYRREVDLNNAMQFVPEETIVRGFLQIQEERQ